METASERIKAKALEAGFSRVGIAVAQVPRPEAGLLQTWLDKGYHASMGWMERRREERCDLEKVLPGARSVVSVALNYYTPRAHSDEPDRGKVSRYAWGDDYHTILLEKLENIGAWMEQEFPEARTTWYVDTGPVMEKVWAARAGIGWEGKHTNIITREYGSWVFLGELITTLSLDPDPPATDHCGTCTLCIEACPTAAITEPYVVDSNLCISYLTIEHRGAFANELGKRFERWIYGCDICQEVCPWNLKFSRGTEESGFSPREGHDAPLLEEWEGMTKEEFSTRFEGSPIRRAKWEGLLRNVRAVQGG